MTQILFVFPRPAENSLELIYLGVPANPYCGDSPLAPHRLGSERVLAFKKKYSPCEYNPLVKENNLRGRRRVQHNRNTDSWVKTYSSWTGIHARQVLAKEP